MQDTFWTPELWCEFLNQRPLIGALETEMEQFKSSKSPKKEWEIVAYRVRDKNVYYPEYTDDIGRIWGNAEWKGAFIDSADVNHPDVKIFSVRRLSDASEWQVKETVEIWETGRFTIQSFEISAGKMLVKTDGGTYLLNALVKLPQAILVTSDGVEIFPGMDFWVLNNDYSLNFWNPIKAGKDDIGKWPDAKLFSTRQAAEEYILNNRPLLSLSDVKEAYDTLQPDETVFGKLTALVKQKLNQ